MNPKAIYGLIGRSLKHSFSGEHFNEKFSREGIDAEYKLIEIEQAGDIRNILSIYPHLRGLNVTIPFKEAIIPYLDSLSEEAQSIGAVNTIAFVNGSLIGHNTDAPAFQSSLIEFISENRPSALILGSGGASKAVRAALEKMEIDYKIVSRNAKPSILTYNELNCDILHEHHLIINTTPLGTYPNIDTFPPIPYDCIGPQHFVMDLVYNPPQSAFLKITGEKGSACLNGLDMLKRQAELSWDIWNREE